MALSLRRQHKPLSLALLLGLLAFAYTQTLAPDLTWANNGSDGGDLITAAATLGIAHPTGYPTYLLLAHLFQSLPIGELAYRTNLLSAAAALIAVAVVYQIVCELDGSTHWRSSAAAALAALSLGLSPVFWSQAIITEVYSLNACFVALILRIILRSHGQAGIARRWPERWAALVVGLALGNHVTVAMPALAWLFSGARLAELRGRFPVIARRGVWICVGLLVYLYLPLRAAAHPPVNWGDAHNWSNFFWEVSGEAYRGLAFGLPSTFLVGRIAAWAGLLLQQFGVFGLGLGFIGLLYGNTDTRWFRGLSAALAAAYSVFAVTYNTADSFAYLIPAYLCFAIWIGLGVAALLATLERWPDYVAASLWVGLLALVLAAAPATARSVDASTDHRAVSYANSVLASAPAHALVITTADLDTFPLWYYHYAHGRRPDLFVIVEPLLEFAWYRENLRFVYPQLKLPQMTQTSWIESLTGQNRLPGPICRTNIESASVLVCTATR